MSHRIASALLLMVCWGAAVSAQVPAGGEFQVNSYTTLHQAGASIASDAAGNFVVAWQSYWFGAGGQDGSGSGVCAQRYDASGTPRGSELRVNTYTSQGQDVPSVASDAAGNFVVAWRSFGQLGGASGSDVFAQRYDSSGAPLGIEFRVNTYTTESQEAPSVASSGTGDFVVTWSWPGSVQRYDASGAPNGAEFWISTYGVESPSVSLDAAGGLVVTWTRFPQDDPSCWFDYQCGDIIARRYGTSNEARGLEFRVNTYTTSGQRQPVIASDPAGNFVVAWESYWQDGSYWGVFAQRFASTGSALGAEFRVNAFTADYYQWDPAIASDAAGNFVVVWSSYGQDGPRSRIFGRRYDAAGAPRGAEFRVSSHTPSHQRQASIASDAVGNFVVAWQSTDQDGDGLGVFARRFGGLVPASLVVDPSASSGSDGNGILEPGETGVAVEPSWRNLNGAAQAFDGVALSFGGPPAGGVGYERLDDAGAYGTVPNDSTARCSDCYQVGVTFGGTRPALHWDASFAERLTPDMLGQTKPWSLHIGESFADVPKASPYYRFVETLLHKGVTAGCSATAYCPANAVTREQMAIFTLVGKEHTGYLPAACAPGSEAFGDVPATSPFCRYVEELSRRGVVSGCGGANYCPGDAVTREQMPIFVLRTLDPALDPPACGTPIFADVPASSPYCRFVEELARRGVVSGCGGGNYCPGDPVTREQMAVFISQTFGLGLYGP